jgi:hypothetical protein
MVQYIEHIFQQLISVKFVAVVMCVGKKNGSFGFCFWLEGRQKPNVLKCALAVINTDR